MQETLLLQNIREGFVKNASNCTIVRSMDAKVEVFCHRIHL